MKMQSNVMAIAEHTGATIVPISYSLSKCHIFSSWDNFLFPYPFGKGIVMIGKTMVVPKKSTPEQLASLEKQAEDELNRITFEADKAVGINPVMPAVVVGPLKHKKRLAS